jgi:hypothetical protein
MGLQRGAVRLDEVPERALVASAGTLEEPPVLRPVPGTDDVAVAALLDRLSRVSPAYAVTRRASWRVAFRSAPEKRFG